MTTENRVNISLNFATDEQPGTVLAAVIAELPPHMIATLANSNAYGFDPTAYTDETRCHLVLHPEGSPAGWYINDEPGATEHAKSSGGLLVELPVTEDHRQAANRG